MTHRHELEWENVGRRGCAGWRRRENCVWGKVKGIRSIIGRYKIGGAKKSMGNGEAKELICMTQGHELKWGNAGRRLLQGGGE